MTVNPHQFGEMKKRLSTEGGFTYNPRSRQFVTEGYSVAAHPAAELRVPRTQHQSGASEGHLQGYVQGSAPIWQQQKAQGRGQEMIGGWRSGEADVLDIPKVFPASPVGHSKSRQAQILRNQEASFSLHEGAEDPNPWFTGSEATPPGRLSQQFPEFAGMVKNKPRVALDPEKYPEVTHWTEQPTRDAAAAKSRRRP